jgi:diadenosine tetraphosphate (Ap4A) HIT family hydrolase
VSGFDLEAYTRSVRAGPCFICALVAVEPAYRHHVVYDDDGAIAFLDRYPTLRGYCLVAPRRHVEDWVRFMGAAPPP